MPSVPAHLRERCLGMLQGGMRTADVARAINCHVCTVRCLRQRYRETGRTADHPCSSRPRVPTPAQDRYIRTSHESWFCLTRGDGRICVYRQRNERYSEACTLEQDKFGGGESVIVWGGVSQHHRTELVVIVGNLNGDRYREDMLLPHVVPFLQAHSDMTLQHDNATSHFF